MQVEAVVGTETKVRAAFGGSRQKPVKLVRMVASGQQRGEYGRNAPCPAI